MLSSESDRDSDSLNSSENLGISIIPMPVPLDARPRYQINVEFKSPNEACRFKKHLAIEAAREIKLMPNCYIRSLGPKDRMVQARK